MIRAALYFFLATFSFSIYAQHISDFTSLLPKHQDSDAHFPSTHTFQYLIEHGDPLTEGGVMPDQFDFTGYVAIDSSSSNGYLAINSEAIPGGVTVLDLFLIDSLNKWVVSRSEKVDFLGVGGTSKNCSGTITPWNTVITCEEIVSTSVNSLGYKYSGWAIEIDPKTKTVIDQDSGLVGGDKLWALGNFKHENVVVHSNERTVYQGIDDPIGYLFKFVADTAQNLGAGKLYAYKGSKAGNGVWVQIQNSTIEERNTTRAQCDSLGVTVFKGIEDVEISPIDSLIYVAVKSEHQIYRFKDSDPLTGDSVFNFETYVGNQTYDITDGNTVVTEPWGTGNDNLVFDDLGNLWVAQDGFKHFIWVVEEGHTQQAPKVKIFGHSPSGSEPTGLTFTPDYNFLFMSFQHPSVNNKSSTIVDGQKIPRAFDKDVAIVVARNELIIGIDTPEDNKKPSIDLFPNPVFDHGTIKIQGFDFELLEILNVKGIVIKTVSDIDEDTVSFFVSDIENGVYIARVKSKTGDWFTKKFTVTHN